MKLILNYRNKLLIWIGCTAVIILACIFGIIWPAQSKLTTIQAEIAATEQQIQTDAIGLQTAIDNQKNAETIQQTLQQLQMAYVSKNNPIHFISRLETLAEEANVQLNFNLGTPINSTDTSSTTYAKIGIHINIQGSLSNSLNFIDQLLREPTYITIEKLTISPESELSSPETVHLTIEALTYWR